jgi:hypothetical protein
LATFFDEEVKVKIAETNLTFRTIIAARFLGGASGILGLFTSVMLVFGILLHNELELPSLTLVRLAVLIGIASTMSLFAFIWAWRATVLARKQTAVLILFVSCVISAVGLLGSGSISSMRAFFLVGLFAQISSLLFLVSRGNNQ